MKVAKWVAALLVAAVLFILAGCPGTTGPNPDPSTEPVTLTEKISAVSSSIDFNGAVIAEDASVNVAVTVKNLKMGGKTLTINASGVVLERVSGARIVIGERVGNGDVTINSCEGISSLEIRGGGAQSVHLTGSKFEVVNVKKDGVRVVMKETEVSEKVTVEARQAKFEVTDSETVSSTETATKIPVLEITPLVDNVNVEGGKIDKILVQSVESGVGDEELAAPAVTVTGKIDIAAIEGKELHVVLKEDAELTSKISVSAENLTLELEDNSSKIENLEIASTVQNVNISGGQIEIISVKTDSTTSEIPAVNITGNVEIKEVTGTDSVNVAADVSGFKKPDGVTEVRQITIDDTQFESALAKVSYTKGDDFDYSGLYIVVTYSNGALKRIQLDSDNCTISGFDSSKAGTVTVKVTYAGTEIGSFVVTVSEPSQADVDEVIVVTARNAVSVIKGLTENKTIKVIGTVTNSQFSRMMDSNNEPSGDVLYSLDLSETTGLTEIKGLQWNVSGITIPASVTNISEGVLYRVEEVNLTEGNKNYKLINGVLYTMDGKRLVVYPTKLQNSSFSVPDGVTNIDREAFWNNNNLVNVSIPSSVTAIGADVFGKCLNLVEITVNSSNTAYKTDAGVLYTKDGKNLICYPVNKEGSKFTIPNGVEIIGQSALSYNENLSSVKIPDGVTKIGSNAFSDCKNLSSVNIPSGVIEIGYLAFCGCKSLNVITIPSSVMKIQHWAFVESGLTNINFAVTDGWYQYYTIETSVSPSELTVAANHTGINSIFAYGNLYRKANITVTASEVVNTIKNLTESCTLKVTGEVSNELFRDMMNAADQLSWDVKLSLDMSKTTGLTKIDWITSRISSSFTIPASVTEISESGLANCYEVKLADGSQSFKIVDDVLYTIDGKTLIYYPRSKKDEVFSVPDGVLRIEGNAFAQSKYLRTISIPASVTEIGEYAFFEVELSQINVASSNTAYKVVDGVLYTMDGKGVLLYPSKKQGNSFVVPDTVETIREGAFYAAKDLMLVTIPESVIFIENYAFCQCRKLTDITIPKNVTRIGYCAFSESGLTSIRFAITNDWYFYNWDNREDRAITPEELTTASNFTSGDLCYKDIYRKTE